MDILKTQEVILDGCLRHPDQEIDHATLGHQGHLVLKAPNQEQNIKYYRCFSITLRRFIKACGIRSINKVTHKTTGKVFWIYKLDEEMENALKAYSLSKEEND